MFKKILIANRGEIALRIVRACHEMGIPCVAVYSDADAASLHVRQADEAVNIGPALSRKSYLNGEAIVRAALETGAEAVHPGYGFLAENASFAQLCHDRGLKFIGPSARTIAMAGDKITARQQAVQSGAPVIPGTNQPASSPEEALGLAGRLGYPVIIKASGGGGGRGMRIVHDDQELVAGLKLAAGEARVSFGNPEVYLEKYLERPRHVEIQILADEYGNCVHLGERECSIQKRYQKLIEESPSPCVDPELRERMGRTAVKIARAMDYSNAGTVEFLVDRPKNFYFMEMNSRIQVEHPVTEMVTGVDLVAQQILIAAGQKLPVSQDQIEQRGWSIECRINAEDPEKNFMPAPGVVSNLTLPGGPWVRLDSHIHEQYEIPPFYDSLLGKLIVWGTDRDQAIRRMLRALGEFSLDGVKTTVPFHQKILREPGFRAGDIHTHFLEGLA